MRVVGLRLEPGQNVPEHRNAIPVALIVTVGPPAFRRWDAARARSSAGEMLLINPGERHTYRAEVETSAYLVYAGLARGEKPNVELAAQGLGERRSTTVASRIAASSTSRGGDRARRPAEGSAWRRRGPGSMPPSTSSRIHAMATARRKWPCEKASTRPPAAEARSMKSQRPRVDLRGRLAAGAAVLVELPTRSRFANLLGGQALVVAVVDLAQERR